MKKAINSTLCIVLFFLAITQLSAQKTNNPEPGTRKPEAKNSFRIAFYNVENLFDTLDDSKIDDSDFLPGARIPWTSERYEVKLSRLGEVIKALSTPLPVAVMGFSEIENKAVLDDLVHSPAIIPYNYQVIHRDSPDERGIDNALIYDAGQFKPIAVYNIPVNLGAENNDRTRDILYVKGLNPKSKSDTLHIFVNHWPSRSEGKEISEPKRIRAAETLKGITDSLFARNSQSLIVILGDLNDEPSDKSIASGLKAEPPVDNPSANKLYNLMYPLYKQGKGTLWYKDWDMFDQVILSGYFWNKERGMFFTDKEGKIFDPDWLMYKPKEGSPRPNRTAAKDYYGGYSDHLPVYIDLLLKK